LSRNGNEISGITGRGISSVNPATVRWRQVWMSSRFHIDYSGGLDENGSMVLEGTNVGGIGAKKTV